MKGLALCRGDHYLDYEDWGEYRQAVSSYTADSSYNVNAFSDFKIALMRLSTPANFSATVASIKLHLYHHKKVRLALLHVGLTLFFLP